ncbi:MAG: hypothetical protein E6Q93_04660 [Burkholderiaceae bacterium]|nr:MAG: hypothetical protein E6Q93_04660 [Burkholderiaceae bacterium]
MSRPYLPWLRLCAQTDSDVLRGSMMDLHDYLNQAGWRRALHELARFGYHVLRRLRAARPTVPPGPAWIVVIDTPGVGGVLTLQPLLAARRDDRTLVLAVTDFVSRDPGFAQCRAACPDAVVVNIDRSRGRLQRDGALLRAVAALLRRHPALAPAVPGFLWRQHAYASVARALFAACDAKAVVLFNERMLPSASFSEAGRRAGIPTVAVQHGNFVDNYLPVLVDHYFTWGRFHSQWLADRGATPRSRAIGSPRMDSRGEPVRRDRPLPAAGPVHLVFFSQVGTASVPPSMISATRRAMLELAGDDRFRVSVKLHPLDAAAHWAREPGPVDRMNFIDSRATLSSVLEDADIACSFYSTVLAEALLWDLPVVQLNPFPETVAGFPDADGIPSVTSARELVDRIDRWRRAPDELAALLAHLRRLREGYFSHLGQASREFWVALDTLAAPGTTAVAPG